MIICLTSFVVIVVSLCVFQQSQISTLGTILVSESSPGTITKYHRLGGLNNGDFLTVMEGGSLRSGCQYYQVLVGDFFPAYREPPSCCVLT